MPAVIVEMIEIVAMIDVRVGPSRRLCAADAVNDLQPPGRDLVHPLRDGVNRAPRPTRVIPAVTIAIVGSTAIHAGGNSRVYAESDLEVRNQ